MRKKRWAPTSTMAACLILVVAAMCSAALGREMERKRRHAMEVERIPAHESVVDAAPMNLCDCLDRPNRNYSLVDDDKRLVPTGSNPLHNR
ncbi:hypothetical protein OPV22_017772 [Ensete ventricosum]|uniref:Uncharacterized protein n=1 Tax=Ensete ventricosum TaxID=4639 RepID=A0AAV8QYQ8_ENSVE|nr:hypothetical protein OPV22_017772 [Ensete ventricosum]RWV88293.1 hypothetical protein GW17_00049636 [Ensete ventricosum]